MIEANGDQLKNNPTQLGEGNFKVIIGANNSGKSTFLRYLTKGRSNAHLVNVDRAVITGEGPYNKNYKQNKQSYSAQIRDAEDDNVSGKNIQVLQELFSLTNKDRKKVIDYYNEYFPNKAIIKLEDSKNYASARILMMSGYSITKQGSGARAVLEILVKLFDDDINLLCIDEPEFALEPRLQKFLFKAIKAKSVDKQIVLSTHSHHFLDRENPVNNFVCGRDRRKKIYLIQVKNQLELRNQIFKLLGNDLSDLTLPNRLIIVEGISDSVFITKLLEISGKDYAVFDARSDSRIKPAIEGITQFLRFINELAPVYLDRIRVVADKQTSDVRVREWRGLLQDTGGSRNRVKVLAADAIEYYYPSKILQDLFNTKDNRSKIIKSYLRNNPNGYNGVVLTKQELAKKVSEKLNQHTITRNQLTNFIQSLEV